VSVDSVVPARALLGECPTWSRTEQLLYWVDIDGRAIHRFIPSTGHDEEAAVNGRPGSFALTDQPGKLLAAVEHQLVWFDFETASASPWRDLEPAGTGNRLNDGRAGPGGRFWVGSMYEDTSAERATGLLHRVEADGSSTVVRDGIGVSNGLAFSPDGRTMYYADSPRQTVWAYDYDPDTGHQSAERVFVDYRDHPGFPDGASVDEDGCYWSAAVYGWALLRFTPDGRLDRQIELPVQKPTMPAFGGPDLRTIYVTSIGGGGSNPPAEGQTGAGDLIAVDAGVGGLPEPIFAGVWGAN
jgi:L-arabinonolactonase